METRDTVTRILEGYVPPDEWKESEVPPREYQLVAAALLQQTGRLLLADEVGTGKTLSSALTFRDPTALPGLVVTLTHLPNQWKREINRALPWLGVHVVRNGPVYDPLDKQRSLLGVGADVLVMNYHKLAKWQDYLEGVVNTVIFDEGQELRRSSSQKWAAAYRVAAQAKNRWALTATPIYNYGAEIHNVVSVLDSEALGTRTEFLREWCDEGGGDKARVKDPAALGEYLRDMGLMLRRTRTGIGRELPDVIRVPHTVDLDEEKLSALTSDAVALAEMILEATGTPTDLWRASGDLDWRLRQATGIAKAPFVAEFVKLLVESGESVVLYGWHRDVYSIWNERLAGLNPAMFTGSESPAAKERNAQRFLDGDTDVLIMSLRAGAGLDGLQDRCKVRVFGELDWSPGVHHQAIGRIHRDGQPDPVVAYFLMADSGSDPVVAEVLNLKRQQSDPILDPNASPLEVADMSDRVKMLAKDFLTNRKTLV